MTKQHEARGPSLRLMNGVFVAVALVVAVALFYCDARINEGYRRTERATERYIAARQAAQDMNAGSDELTDLARCFVVNGDIVYLQKYFEEANVTRRRDRAVEQLGELFDGQSNGAHEQLKAALGYSNELMELEYHAMRLTQTALGFPDGDVPEVVSAWPLSTEDAALPREEKLVLARKLVFDEAYMGYKTQIKDAVSQCTDELLRVTREEMDDASDNLNRLLAWQTLLTIALLLVVLALVTFISTQVRSPLTRMVRLMRDKQMIPASGAEELRFVARTYNQVFEENQQANQSLTYDVMHDALTGVYNRRAYEMFMQDMAGTHIALLIIDVDDFKSINDTCGHDGGDRVLRRVVALLQRNFRSVDMICRIGGDEFAVIMTRVDSTAGPLIKGKIERINQALAQPQPDGTPLASVSVGVAFGDRLAPGGDLFKEADTALYEVKGTGRRGCKIAGESGGTV